MPAPELIKDIITKQDQQVLIDYLETEDDRSDIRPDVSSKHPRWNIDHWPQYIVERALEKIFDLPNIFKEKTGKGFEPMTRPV